MARDGLMPAWFSKLTPRRTPARTTVLFGTLIAFMAALLPLSEIAELVNIGTLFAFFVVNVGVIILRRTQPDLERRFRVPFVPVVPAIGALLCVYLMIQLPLVTWARFGIWLLAGLLIYAFYGRRNSKVQQGLA
jgi:APA family basic amino acid/polyamine antiporter